MVRALIAIALWGVTASAQARSLEVRLHGCDDVIGLHESLSMELAASGWAIGAAPAEVTAEIELRTCDDRRWTVRFVEGPRVHGPFALDLGDLPARSRARLAALWISEWLQTVHPSEGARALAPPATPPSPDAPPAPGAPSTLRLRFGVLASVQHHPTGPVTLGGGDVGLQIARIDSPILGLELGVGLDAGRHNDFELLAWNAQLTGIASLWALPSLLEVTVGARLSVHHLLAYGFGGPGTQEVTSPWGATVGGVLRGTLFVERGWAVVLEAELGGAVAPWIVTWRGGLDAVDERRIAHDFYLVARAGVAIE